MIQCWPPADTSSALYGLSDYGMSADGSMQGEYAG